MKSTLNTLWKDWCWKWNSNTWPPDTNSWLIGKDPDAGKNWRQRQDEMVGWHHWFNGQEVEQTLGDDEMMRDREAWCAVVHGDAELDMSYWLKNNMYSLMGLPRWLSGKESTCQCRRCGLDPWDGRVPWRRKWKSTPVFLPGKSHGQRNLVGCTP